METSAERSDTLRNLSECAREPIQIIGHIQPHGVLFALSEPNLIVRQVSANVSTAIGLCPDRVLGNSIENLLGVTQFEKLRSLVMSDEPLASESLQINDANGHLLAANGLAHRYDGVLILERKCSPNLPIEDLEV
jgi:chemotaxis family two-component system sensor kinase Cph1